MTHLTRCSPQAPPNGGPIWAPPLRLKAALSFFSLYSFIKRHSGLNTPGLGFVLRGLNQEFTFSVQGRQFVFSPECGPAYCLLPAGIWNEPETHLFFDHLIGRDGHSFHFIDVGASVGEMVMDVASRSQALSVLAFEPQSACAAVISRSSLLNGFDQVQVRPMALSDFSGRGALTLEARSPTAASVSDNRSGSGAEELVQVSTLDTECATISGDVLMLLDVEGAEPKVLAGGLDLIRRTLPCIVFEYNDVSKQCFSLSRIRQVLGDSYEIYRLRSDGRLDMDLKRTWNCVAVHSQSVWAATCHSLVVGKLSEA